MELEQLRQLQVIAECGTLAKASETLHISQSALSRSIKKLEDELGVSLFDRTKNSMYLNDVGEVALQHARVVLSDATRLKEAMAEHARERYTLHIGACAPAPLWRLVPMIAERAPEYLVIPKMDSLKNIESDLLNRVIDFAILPYALDLPNIVAITLMTEELQVVLPSDHPLAGRASIKLSELDGEIFLLYQRVGFWRELLQRHIPDAHYVVQDDYLVFSQLSKTSPLPGFVTNVSETERFIGDRVVIPIEDDEARVTYRLIARNDDARWRDLIDWVNARIQLV